MKTFLKNCFWFSFIFVIFYPIIIFITTEHNQNLVFRKQGGHLYLRLNEIPNYSKIDVLFLGSSHAYRGFDTRIFTKKNIKSFNLGSSSQSPRQTLYFLEKYLNHFKCDKIIFEVNPLMFNSDGIESTLDIISYGNIDWPLILMCLESKNIKVFNTLIYSIVRTLLGSDKNFYYNNSQAIDSYISGGFVERKTTKYMPKNKSSYENLNDSQLQSFNMACDLIKNNNIDLILVQAPVTSSEYIRFSNNKYFDQMMSSTSTYYNFNELIQLNDSLHFYDNQHLNQSGVEIFNNHLIDLLQQ